MQLLINAKGNTEHEKGTGGKGLAGGTMLTWGARKDHPKEVMLKKELKL